MRFQMQQLKGNIKLVQTPQSKKKKCVAKPNTLVKPTSSSTAKIHGDNRKSTNQATNPAQQNFTLFERGENGQIGKRIITNRKRSKWEITLTVNRPTMKHHTWVSEEGDMIRRILECEDEEHFESRKTGM